VVLIFSMAKYKGILETEKLEGKILFNINKIRSRAGLNRLQKSKNLSKYAKKIAFRYLKNSGKPIWRSFYNVLVYQTYNPEIIPEIHTAFFLTGENRSSIGFCS